MTVRIITDSNGRKHITNEPLLHQPAPAQSCYCPNCEAMGKELAALKAQPAPVLEPVAWRVKVETKLRDGSVDSGYQLRNERLSAYDEPLYTTPPTAQPAVPDAFGTREGEHPQYIQGWNDCRAEMLSMRKRVKP